tara:strand:- start:200 stop:316 length:117 start_codon:yes stop_codon:yes gene_type:complete
LQSYEDLKKKRSSELQKEILELMEFLGELKAEQKKPGE